MEPENIVPRRRYRPMGRRIYIYTSYIGVPMLYKTKIVGNTITADINWDTAAEESVQTRAEGELQTVPQGFIL